MPLSAVGLYRLHLQWRFWLVCSQDDILTHLENHTTANLQQPQRKQSTEPSRGVFQGRSLSQNIVIRCPVRKIESFQWNVWAWRGDIHFKPSETHRGQRWDWGRGREEGRGSQIPQMLRVNTSSGSSGFLDAPKRSLPRTLTHTCVRAGQSTQPRKKHNVHGSRAPDPLGALSPLLHDQSLFTFVG